MNYKLGFIIILLLIALSSTASADIWVSDSGIVSGLSDIGVWSAPTVFNDGGILKLISGEQDGIFNGYQWSGSTWVSNSSIITGLADVGTLSRPTVYNDGGILKLISGSNEGTFYGYQWNGTAWESNSSIINGLNAVTNSAPTVFNDSGTWKLINGLNEGTFHGYQWSGSTWVSNSSIISGLGNIGYGSTPTVYNDSGIWKLISGEHDGTFNGYQWSGSIWTSNSSIVTGLGDVGSESTPTVFNDGGILKLISGEYWGAFYGWYLNENPPTIPTSFTDLGNNLIDHTPTITWTKGTDADGDTVSTYVYVGITSTPTTFEGSTTSETFDLGTNTTLTNGNTYYYRLRSYDGHFYSDYTTADEFRMNTPPSISNVTISPTPTIDTDDLTANNDTATDAEGDSITLYYRWYNNSILQTALNDVVTVNQNNLTTDDIWKVGIIPNDGYENGTEIQSSTTTIGSSNVAPTLTGITTNVSSIKWNKTLLVSTVNADDLNGDNYILHIGTASGLSDICNSSSTPNGTEASCSFVMNHTSGSYTLYGRLTDSNDMSIERSIVYSVDTTPPVLDSSSINPNSFTNDESTTISASVSVANGTVDWVKVKIRDYNYISTNHTMNLINGTYIYIYSPSASGNYEITHFYASDDSLNIMTQAVSHAFEVSTGSTGGAAGGGGAPEGVTNVTIAGDLVLTPDRRDTYFFYTALSGEQSATYQFIANRDVNYCSVEPNDWATCEIVDGYIIKITLTVDEKVSSYDGIVTIRDENDYVVTSTLVVRVVKLFGAIPIGNYEVGGFAELLNIFFETSETSLIGIRTWFIGLILAGFGYAVYRTYSI